MAADGARPVKHSLLIAGHSTSISLEDAFWRRLRIVAARRDLSIARLVAAIDAGRGDANLSAAIRVFLLEEALAADGNAGGATAPHGEAVAEPL